MKMMLEVFRIVGRKRYGKEAIITPLDYADKRKARIKWHDSLRRHLSNIFRPSFRFFGVYNDVKSLLSQSPPVEYLHE